MLIYVTTDVQEGNIMLSIADTSTLDEVSDESSKASSFPDVALKLETHKMTSSETDQ